MKYKTLLSIIFLFTMVFSSSGEFTIARIHYNGGGDWYADPSSLFNLLKFVNKNTSIPIKKEEIVSIGDDSFYKHNYFYMTGHGNIKLDNEVFSLHIL